MDRGRPPNRVVVGDRDFVVGMVGMTRWKFTAQSSRSTARVLGRIELWVEADSREAAEELIRSSLPGSDWGTWESTWGAVAVTETPHVERDQTSGRWYVLDEHGSRKHGPYLDDPTRSVR